MPKKSKRVPKNGPVWHRTAEEATLDQTPKFNAHACKPAPTAIQSTTTPNKEAAGKENSTEGPATAGLSPFHGQPNERCFAPCAAHSDCALSEFGFCNEFRSPNARTATNTRPHGLENRCKPRIRKMQVSPNARIRCKSSIWQATRIPSNATFVANP